jgi:hypothetical protein
MRTIIFIICVLFCGFFILAQPAIQWQKTFGGSKDDIPYFACSDIITSDGSFFIAGYTSSSNGNVTGFKGTNDFWAIKLNTSGTLQWQKTYGGLNDDYATAYMQTSDYGYIIVGGTNSNDGDVSGNHGSYDIWIIKIKSDGTIDWKKCYGGSDADYAYGVTQSSDGGFLIVGKTWSNDGDVTNNKGNGDAWVLKITSKGVLQWQKTLGGTGEDNLWNIKQTTDGGYFIAGTTTSKIGDLASNHGGWDYWLIKLTSTGSIVWQNCYGGTKDDYAYTFCILNDGKYLITGESGSNDGNVTGNHGGLDIWVIMINSTGNIQWQKTYGGSADDWACSIRPGNDGTYLISGATKSNNGDFTGNHGDWDGCILRINSGGNLLWSKLFGGTGDDEFEILQQTTDNGYIVSGYTSSNDGDVSGNHGSYDFWVLKLASNASSVEYTNLYDPIIIYPNPSEYYIKMSYENLQTDHRVIYSIIDFVGNIILTGTTELNEKIIDTNSLEPGLYLLEIKDETGIFTKRFIKI